MSGAGRGPRPSPNRCPLQRGSGGGRRGVSLPLLAAWPTPGAVLCWLVLSAAFAKPTACGFGIEGRSGWKPWLCRFLASRCEHTLSATQCLLQKLGLVTAPYRAVVLTSGKALAQSVVGDTFGARQWVAALLLPLRWGTQGGINTGWSMCFQRSASIPFSGRVDHRILRNGRIQLFKPKTFPVPIVSQPTPKAWGIPPCSM